MKVKFKVTIQSYSLTRNKQTSVTITGGEECEVITVHSDGRQVHVKNSQGNTMKMDIDVYTAFVIEDVELTPLKCPVCEGLGEVIDVNSGHGTSSVRAMVACSSCEGSGIIWRPKVS